MKWKYTLKGFSAVNIFLSFVGNVFVELSNKIPIIFFTQHPHLNYTLYHYHLLVLFGTTGHAELLVQKYLTVECFALHTTLRLPRRQIPRILISTDLRTKLLASTLTHGQFGKSTKHILCICLVPFLQHVLGTLDYLEGINWSKSFMHRICACLLAYLLTPWSRVLLEKRASLQLVKKFPPFYGARTFLTSLTSARHLSLSWASPIQSSYPNPTSWRSILILSSHLRLGLTSGLFPSGFPTLPLPFKTVRLGSSGSLVGMVIGLRAVRSGFKSRYWLEIVRFRNVQTGCLAHSWYRVLFHWG